MSHLRFDNVSKTFAGKKGERIIAVRNLSWEITSDELLVLIGPSGCGKTTILRMIAGLETPDSGEISVAGTVVNQVPPQQRDVAMVFQTPALFPHLTVAENIGLGLKLRRCDPTVARERVLQAAATLGLESKLNQHPQELSGGEGQRVALGRAMVRQPKLFLLDEPLSNLDPGTRKQLRREILRLHQTLKIPMIYVTHDHREALAMGGRIAVINAGELQQIGTAEEIRRAPANGFVASFLEDEME